MQLRRSSSTSILGIRVTSSISWKEEIIETVDGVKELKDGVKELKDEYCGKVLM